MNILLGKQFEKDQFEIISEEIEDLFSRTKRKLSVLILMATLIAILAEMMFASSAFAVERYQIIQNGDKDEYVLKLQKELYSRGYLKSEPTGYFGDETQDALERYQESRGVEADGKAGPETQKEIFGKWYKEITSSRDVSGNTAESSSSESQSSSSSESQSSSSSSSGANRYQIMIFGDKDDYVLRLQKELYTRGYLKSEPTGYYGKETEDAVWNYQSRKGLKADGKSGVETQKQIFGKWYEEIPSSRDVSGNTAESSSSLSNSGESSSSSGSETSSSGVKRYQVMMYGDNDEYVLKLQKELYSRGYLKTEPTGYYGKETQSGVARYQESKGIDSDGKAGMQTQKEIFGKWYKDIPSTREVSDIVDSDNTGSSVDRSPDSIRNGDEGSIVEKMQVRMKELGYFNHKTTNYYGDITEAGIVSFQEQNGLNSDGVAGKRTQKALFSSEANKFKASKKSKTSKEKASPAKSQTDDGKASAKNVTIKAQGLIGKKYRTGGTGPNTFDCSGFIYYILKSYGMSTPRTSREMSAYSSWTKISNRKNLEAGDLVFFTSPNSGSSVGHVGIYLGGDKFIHCSSGSAKSVTISNLSGNYYSTRFKWGRRIFD